MLAFGKGGRRAGGDTIIENGLDIPRRQHQMVHRADPTAGPAYQLRGPRPLDRRAHAFLMVPPDTVLSMSREALSAIASSSELGAGSASALDLDCGGGNLLGGEQSGHIERSGSTCT